METEVSRALDLAFDNKDLAVYGKGVKEEPSIDLDTIEKTVSDSKPLTQTNLDKDKDFKLKINS